MATNVNSKTELEMKLRLSKTASDKLIQRATETGRDLGAIASELIEQAVGEPTVDQALAPFRKQVADSGMNDAELDALFQAEIDAHRLQKKAKSA
jgi:hypothetical protein